MDFRAQIENILELPLPHRLGVLAGTLVFVVGIFYVAFYRTTATELGTLREQIEGPRGLRAQISEQRGIAKHLDQFRAEVQVLDVELKRVLAQLPDKKEIPTLLSKISDKAHDAGLEVRLFKPQAEAKKDFYSSVPVEIEVGGTFHEVATFFDEVGRLDRIVNLDNIAVTEPVVSEDDVTVKTSVIATAFRFLEESERPQNTGEGDSKGKRRTKAAKTPKKL